jgi:hypothetical protein
LPLNEFAHLRQSLVVLIHKSSAMSYGRIR